MPDDSARRRRAARRGSDGLVTATVLALAGLTAGFSASLALTAITLGHVPLGTSLLVLLLGGSCGPALTGGLSSQVSRLAKPEALPRIFGVDALTYNLAGIAGPALSGLTASLVSSTAAALLMAGLSAAGAVLAAVLPVRQERAAGATGRPSLTAGARAVVANKTLATVILASAVGQLGPGAVPVVAALAAKAHHHASASGFMLTAVAVGGLLGSLLWTARPAPTPRAPAVVMLAMCGTGLPVLVGAITTSLPVLTVALALSGFFLGPLVGALFTARNALSPEEVRAQVFTIGAGLKITAAAAGTATIGLLAAVPLAVQFLIVGLNPIATGLIGLTVLRTLAKRPARARAGAEAEPHPRSVVR
ncbi:MFS transporter [Dactylosporangium sp. NPDC000555]|uniref:MFS transporter n=1 Tax=Dactylosporangium sp. NPDC000555 TaxID=3154260 RepID=UPI00333259AA